MRALLAVGYIFFFAGPNQNAMVLWSRVGEEFHAAYRDFAYLGDFNGWKRGSPRKTRFRQNPKVTYEHPQACESEKLRELATCHVALIAGEHREFIFPERLLTGAAKKRHTTPPTCNPEHRVKPHLSRREPS